MKVLVVTRAGVGGAARHVLDVVRGLAPWHRISVFASPVENPDFLPALADAGAEVTPLPLARSPNPAADLRALATLRSAFRELDLDVVHAHTAKAGALARLAGSPAPVVYSPHGFYHHYPTAAGMARAAALAAERRLVSSTAVLALSAEWERAAAERDGLVPRGGAAVVPNGVPVPDPLPAEERTAVRAELGVREGQRLVLMVGRLAAPKDPLHFLSAAVRAGPDHRFVLVGDGPMLEQCRAYAPPNALVAGRRDDAARLLGAADVAVLTTNFEAAPYYLLEAMAAGVPVVATDLPSTREMLGDGGLYVDAGDADTLARRVARATGPGPGLPPRYAVEAMLRATEAAWEAAR